MADEGSGSKKGVGMVIPEMGEPISTSFTDNCCKQS